VAGTAAPPWVIQVLSPGPPMAQLNVVIQGRPGPPIGFVRVTRQHTLADVRVLIAEEVGRACV
jgi:hypothetical protein